MDTSEIYTKQCEKVPFELSFKLGDYIYSYDRKKIEILIDFEQLIGELNPTKLYRQDQLQGMVKEPYQEAPQAGLWYKFQRFITRRIVDVEEDDLPSWEQLWLYYVMKEKYGKTWDDEKEEWIK
jgi:hypothetical protein